MHITTRTRIWRWLLTYLISSKEANDKACEIWLKLRLHKDMATFQTLETNMNRPSWHNWKVTISFSKCNLRHFERVTTHYQTLQTWIGFSVMSYHNLNALPHAWRYIFSEISLVLGYLQRVCYHHFFKYIDIFFINSPK